WRSSLQSAAIRPACLSRNDRCTMSIERIEHALKEIEQSLPSGPAQVRFDVCGGGVDERFIRGSRAGIARFRIRLIRVAFQPEQKKSINEPGIAIRYMFLLLFCFQGLCQTPEQASQPQTLAGTFESAARGDSLFSHRTSTNGVPLFTLTVETN